MAGPNEQAIRDLYADDPFVSPHWFGVMIEDAQEQDRVNALWAERAEAEAEELAELEEVEQ